VIWDICAERESGFFRICFYRFKDITNHGCYKTAYWV
jgi:hypothetical protein